MFINPQWDPLRDLITRPISDFELNEMQRIVENLNMLLDNAIIR
jgi:hypothetical protein